MPNALAVQMSLASRSIVFRGSSWSRGGYRGSSERLAFCGDLAPDLVGLIRCCRPLQAQLAIVLGLPCLLLLVAPQRLVLEVLLLLGHALLELETLHDLLQEGVAAEQAARQEEQRHAENGEQNDHQVPEIYEVTHPCLHMDR